MKRNKYGAKPTTVNGIRFHSKRESEHYLKLRRELLGGKISDLELQPSYQIAVNGMKICSYIADFRYNRDGVSIVEDVKGMDTSTSKLKRKLVKALYGVDVVIIK